MSKFICKVFGHKMYNISWNKEEFTVLCTRCECQWGNRDVK